MVLMVAPVQALATEPLLSASPTSTSLHSRLNGADRVGTSVAIAQSGWSNGSSSVIIAPADDSNLVDALSVAPLAGELKAPILLTNKGALDPQLLTEIAALHATKIYAVGALSQAVISSLQGISGLNVTVVQGADRFETAAKVASMLSSPAGSFVVGYSGLADAMSIASYAAANNYAILIANPDGSLPVQESTFEGSNVYIVGGPTLVNDITGATRLYGTDRYATNDKVLTSLSYKYDKVYVANGETLVDALAGSALAAQTNSPIILANSTAAPAAADVSKSLTSNSQVVAFGGSAVVPDSVVGSIARSTEVQVAPINVTTVAGTAPILPPTVSVTMGDGTTQNVAVTWTTPTASQYAAAGTYTVTGTIANLNALATANVTVTAVGNTGNPSNTGDGFTFTAFTDALTGNTIVNITVTAQNVTGVMIKGVPATDILSLNMWRASLPGTVTVNASDITLTTTATTSTTTATTPVSTSVNGIDMTKTVAIKGLFNDAYVRVSLLSGITPLSITSDGTALPYNTTDSYYEKDITYTGTVPESVTIVLTTAGGTQTYKLPVN